MAKKKAIAESRIKVYSREYKGYLDEMPEELKVKIEAKKHNKK